MVKEISIADTEWKIMEVLWEENNLTIGDIREKLSSTGWSDSTIKTLVRRLVQKGAVRVDDRLGQFRYFSDVSEAECKKKETRNLINRVYNGSIKMLVANLVSDSNLTDDETKRLMELIDKMEEGSK